ncbi:hypothetical protein O181_028231 [Austropuccinia psidii MF-1]|uniref:Uncharacterized protein n=1 Tax=Austropuccinia psidii MF-1 TaxID=1389203 RepID=A0A9Q3H266_9BASI|nr:hypothetical protein [Austropuccinia psidii MF-1]
MRESYLRQLTIMELVGENAVEVKLTQELFKENQVFPVSLVKPYHQTDGDKFSKKKEFTSPGKLVAENSPGTLNRVLRARRIKINGKYHRQYLVRLKSQEAEKDKWLPEQEKTDGKYTPGGSEPPGRQKSIINDEPFFRRECQPMTEC